MREGVDWGSGQDNGRFYIQTVTGRHIFFDRPEDNDYVIEDIAHAAAMNCRFTGHCRFHYSVAQHCVLGSYMVPSAHALGFLLHDANEAYLHDDPTPLKKYLAEQGFEAKADLEHHFDAAIFRRFGVPYPMHSSIKDADKRMLWTEKRDLMPGPHAEPPVAPFSFIIEQWAPEVARLRYLSRFYELTNGGLDVV